jgi:nondiscriminating aspartyl-tRNA synthetase
LNLDTFFDEMIRDHEKAAFNCGLPTESIIMTASDLINIVKPKFGRFTKA